MMYLRIKDGVITYPYSVQQLKVDEYNTSFPNDLTTQILEEWGVYEVSRTPKPNDYTKTITEGTPQLVDGLYVQISCKALEALSISFQKCSAKALILLTVFLA